jgi:hypothetical protein
VNDHNPKTDFMKIVLVLEPLVDGNQYFASTLGSENQLGVRKSAPLCLGYGQDLIIRKSLSQSGINTLV